MLEKAVVLWLTGHDCLFPELGFSPRDKTDVCFCYLHTKHSVNVKYNVMQCCWGNALRMGNKSHDVQTFHLCLYSWNMVQPKNDCLVACHSCTRWYCYEVWDRAFFSNSCMMICLLLIHLHTILNCTSLSIWHCYVFSTNSSDTRIYM